MTLELERGKVEPSFNEIFVSFFPGFLQGNTGGSAVGRDLGGLPPTKARGLLREGGGGGAPLMGSVCLGGWGDGSGVTKSWWLCMSL